MREGPPAGRRPRPAGRARLPRRGQLDHPALGRGPARPGPVPGRAGHARRPPRRPPPLRPPPQRHAGPRAGREDGLPGENVVQLGIGASTNRGPYADGAREHGITWRTADEVRDVGGAAAMRDALAHLADCEVIAVDLDVGPAAPSAHAPACPGARPGGLAPHDLFAAARVAGRRPRVVGRRPGRGGRDHRHRRAHRHGRRDGPAVVRGRVAQRRGSRSDSAGSRGAEGLVQRRSGGPVGPVAPRGEGRSVER